MSFRCSAASLERHEPLVGTASTVRAFVLLECPGPWGVHAISDSRIPDEVKERLRGLERDGARPLMIRGGRRPQGTEGVRLFVAYVDDTGGWVQTALLSDVRELCDVPLDGVAGGRRPSLTSYDGDLFCVCTHGRHDACCAERGRPVWEAVRRAAPEETWQVSHIGGDRFAANVLVLPRGLYYGRVEAAQARELVHAHQHGRLDLDHLRGRTNLSFPAQAAEVFLRRMLDIDDVAPLPVRRLAARRFELVADGRRWEVEVVRRPFTERLTCRAEDESAGWAFDVVRVRQVGEGVELLGGGV